VHKKYFIYRQTKNLSFVNKRIWILLFLFIITCPLKAQPSYPFPLEKNEQVLSIKAISGRNIAFIVKHDRKLKYTSIKAVTYSPQGKNILQQSNIDSVKINSWQSSPLKGKVRQNFENAVLSGKNSDNQAPFEYQYQISYSPDEKTILCYRYDYSQPTLYVQAFILNASLQKVKSVQLPIDDGMTNHGIFINNKAQLFILNSDEGDGIQLICYEFQTETSTLLEIAASSTRRNSFKPYFLNDSIIYIANITESNGNLTGVMYSRFNFEKERVESVQFQPLSKEMHERIHNIGNKGNYDLISFRLDSKQNIHIVLEKRNIAATDYMYNSYASNDPQEWKSRKVQVQTGEKLTYEFDASGKLLSEKAVE
jgi:hypothetical protein